MRLASLTDIRREFPNPVPGFQLKVKTGEPGIHGILVYAKVDGDNRRFWYFYHNYYHRRGGCPGGKLHVELHKQFPQSWCLSCPEDFTLWHYSEDTQSGMGEDLVLYPEGVTLEVEGL